MSNETIQVNIWDDYYDDDFVPAGEVQETYAYVEQDLDDEASQQVLALLKAQIEALQPPGTPLRCDLVYYDSAVVYPNLVGTEHERLLYKRWQLNMQSLTHRERERLVDQLARTALMCGGARVVVYSES
jgi:hypothetical protein